MKKDIFNIDFSKIRENNEKSCLNQKMIETYKNVIDRYLDNDTNIDDLISSSIIVFNLHKNILKEDFDQAITNIATDQKDDIENYKKKINPINWNYIDIEKNIIEKTQEIIQLCEEAIKIRQKRITTFYM